MALGSESDWRPAARPFAHVDEESQSQGADPLLPLLGIEDIFTRITRAPHTRDDLWRRLKELVDKRNSIAHGDLATAATAADIRAYVKAVHTFAVRSDAVLARQLSAVCAIDRPW